MSRPIPVPVQMEQMKNELHLGMPPVLFSHCVNHFQLQERRYPQPNELLLLDSFSAILSRANYAVAISDLFTNDTCVAETYADLLAKRRALYPDLQTVPKLSELLSIADEYLERTGKPQAHEMPLISIEELAHTATRTSSKNSIVVKDSTFATRALSVERNDMHVGDFLLLLSPSEDLSDDLFKSRLNLFFSESEEMYHVKDFRMIGELGLLFELISLPLGTDISIPRFLQNGKALLPALFDAYVGKYMLCVSPDHFQALADALQKQSIHVTTFGILKQPDRITAFSNQQYVVDLPIPFLKSFYLISPIAARTADESIADAPISHLPLVCDASRYLRTKESMPIGSTTVTVQNSLLASAACRAQSSFFQNTVDTALTAVLSLAISGTPFEAQSLAVALALPESNRAPKQLGNTLSTVLGLYRVQTELALRTVQYKITTAPALQYPALTVSTIASGKPIPGCLQFKDTNLTLITPTISANGLPDFDELRALLTRLSALAMSGQLLSARVIARESLAEAVAQMSTDTLTCALDDTIGTCAPRLAILCETREVVEGDIIGQTIAMEAVSEEKETPDEPLTLADCIIPSEIPTITLYARADDTDATLLSDALRRRNVELFYLTPEDGQIETKLFRAILSSQTLIVGIDAKLPLTPAVKLALATLTKAKGQILFPSQKIGQTGVKGTPLKYGLTEQMLDAICQMQKD